MVSKDQMELEWCKRNILDLQMNILPHIVQVLNNILAKHGINEKIVLKEKPGEQRTLDLEVVEIVRKC